MSTDLTKVQERFDTLPPQLQEAIVSKQHQKTIADLCARFRLTGAGAEAVDQEVLLVLLGVLDPTDFPQAIINDTGLGRSDSYALAQEINRQIFSQLSDAFHELYDREKQDEEYFYQVADEVIKDEIELARELDNSQLGSSDPDRPAQLSRKPVSDAPDANAQSLIDMRMNPQQEGEGGERVLTDRNDNPIENRDTYKGSDPYRETF